MEQKVTIRLKSIEDVKTFVSVIEKYEGDFDIHAGRYIVDAKSIMCIFSLDLSQPLGLAMSNATPQLMQDLKPYLVTES